MAHPTKAQIYPFPDDISDKIGKQLQLRLVELIASSLTGKQLLWNAYEREFLSAHRHLDLVVDEWRELEDAVAERAASVGILPDASAPAVVALAQLWKVVLRFGSAPKPTNTAITINFLDIGAAMAAVSGDRASFTR